MNSRVILTLIYLIWCTMLVLLSFEYTEHFIAGSPLIFVFLIGQLAFLGFSYSILIVIGN